MYELREVCKRCGAEIRPGKKFCRNCGTPVTPEILHARYKILRILGQGGMSTIYLAEDNNLGQRLVAVKKMTLSRVQSQEELEKVLSTFEQEALLLAKLSHPNLPSIYEHFNDNEHWYIVMQYIRGETLTQRIRLLPDERVPPEDVLTIGIKLCEVLSYLHSQNPPVIFSDLKPDNIMLTPEGNLYLIDFGIARLFQTTLADDRKFVSEGYSPPEQYESVQLSPRADIYSLGASLHQMLLGHHAVRGKGSFASLQLEHQQWAIELEALITSMLKRNVEERPSSVILVRQALQHIAGLYVQEQDKSIDAPIWNRQTSLWATISSNTTSIDALVPGNVGVPTVPASPPASSQDLASSSIPTVEVSSLPAFVACDDIRLSLRTISALAWSPGGSFLAAANRDELHLYTWPPEEYQFTFDDERLIPLRTWTLESLHPSSEDVDSRESAIDWLGVSTVPVSVRYEESLIMAWSPDSKRLAITGEAFKSEFFTLDVTVQDSPVVFRKQKSPLWAIAWSANGKFIASGGNEHVALVEEVRTGQNISSKIHSGSVTAIAWSPDGTYLASASSDGMIQVWEAISGRQACAYQGHSEYVHDILWMPDGAHIISCGEDHTIQVWDAKTAQKLRSLEAHTESVQRIALLDQGHLLASLSKSGNVRIWNTGSWAEGEDFKTTFDLQFRNYDVAFHSSSAIVAKPTSLGIITLYEVDLNQVYNGPAKVSSVQYTNAKVVLLGDSGVGKTGLGLVLSHQSFRPTESTHGRTVWTFVIRESKLSDGRKEFHETLLWDLAGQPGYRLIHQLYLSEVAVALVVFDAHSETDPFAGIFHWVRALRTAQKVRGNTDVLKMLLVLARIDRGGRRVSQNRIDELIQKLEFDGYYETSAKEGTNIAELAAAIKKAIDWEQLPKITSTELFQRIRSFLVAEKEAGRLLSTADDLYRSFLRAWSLQEETKNFSAEFATGIRLLESTGLIRRLSFGNLVLLQPELLDTYASALVNAVRDQPDGLGSISEEAVHAAAFAIPVDERIKDLEQEKLLLIAMVQDLLFYEITLREQGENGPYLVFPSESTRENPDLPNPENASTIFTFEGPVLNIYATLAVRLSHSGFFTLKELWKNAVIYNARPGGTCGIWLKMIEDGKGELTLFFDAHVSEETRSHFEEYVQVHLQRKALPDSVKSQYIQRCECGFVIPDQLIRMRTELGYNYFICPVCDHKVGLRYSKEGGVASRVPEMDRAADIQRNRAAAQSTVQGKRRTGDYDVFVCYNPVDRVTVIDIGKSLKEQGILPWLDVWELQPGLSWQHLLEQQIGHIKSAAVFVGKDGLGPWQQQELEAFLREFVRRNCPVIPVILSDAPAKPTLPIFLAGITWVDFRKQALIQDMAPMDQLIWGITGKRQLA